MIIDTMAEMYSKKIYQMAKAPAIKYIPLLSNQNFITQKGEIKKILSNITRYKMYLINNYVIIIYKIYLSNIS